MAADQWALILPNWTDKMQAASIRGRRINQAPLVLRERYLAKNAAGTIVEKPAQLFWRVATDIAQAERLYPITDGYPTQLSAGTIAWPGSTFFPILPR